MSVQQAAHRIGHRLVFVVAFHEHGVKRRDATRATLPGTLNQPPLTFADIVFDFSCGGANTDGVVLEAATIAGAQMKKAIYGTTMRVDLARPLAPGASVDLEFVFS